MNNWKKIRQILLILFLVGGLLFVIFAVFFNRAELQISAEAPFNIDVVNQRGKYCEASPCSIVLAPGTYLINVSKTDYQDYSDEVTLPLGTTVKKDYQLVRLPKLETLDAASVEAAELQGVLTHTGLSGLPPDNQYFFAPDGTTVYFLADNPDTYLPSLYRKSLDDQERPQLLLNFLRKVEKPLIKINLEQTKVALIDQSDPQNANLYLLDLEAKSRTLIDQNDLITDALWLAADGNSQYLLIEKVNRVTLNRSLSLIDTANPASQTALTAQTLMTAVLPYSADQIIYAELFPPAADGSAVKGFSLKLLNLRTQLSQNIFDLPGYNLPQKMKFQSKSGILLMLIDGVVYSLSPIL